MSCDVSSNKTNKIKKPEGEIQREREIRKQRLEVSNRGKLARVKLNCFQLFARGIK